MSTEENKIDTRPIIFLDIDGVLNCQIFYEKRHAENKDKMKKESLEGLSEKEKDFIFYSSQICRDRISWLNVLCKEINAVIVISSSWRSGRTIEELQEIMDYFGATFTIIGKTPHTGYERGTEISKWLKDNIKPETHGCHYFDFYKYAIIDDDSDMLLNQGPNFFKTDNYSGLTPNTCYKIKRFITKKTF